VPVGADQAGRSAGPVRGHPGHVGARQAAQCAGDRLPVTGVADAHGGAAVQDDHVGDVPAEHLGGLVGFTLAFAGTFFALFLELWQAVRFPVPADEKIDPGLRDQLGRYRDGLGADVPIGALLTFLRCWTLLYGAVAMEVFGHMSFALEDPAPMFEITLGDLASLVGLRYPLGP
jgi:hypothetical protein